jgi:hypothetical protein
VVVQAEMDPAATVAMRPRPQLQLRAQAQPTLTAGDISGKLRLIYGSGPADPAPFVLTLTPQYMARVTASPKCHVSWVEG